MRGIRDTLRRHATGLTAILLLVVGFAWVAPAAGATTITVTTTDDELNADGDCSLREAIQAANTDAPVDACPGGSGADTVNVPAGTYTLAIPGADADNTTGDLNIEDDLSLVGAGQKTTIIDGADLDRVLFVGTSTVQVSRVTIRNGSGGFGAGLLNLGTLTVTNSTISDNVSFGGGAGGVSNHDEGAVLNLNDVTVTGNTADFGGGLFNRGGTATITDSTIAGNTATFAGGGIINTDEPAIATLTIENSNVADNSANEAAGVANYGGTLTLVASTMRANTTTGCCGVALDNRGNATVESSTFSNNSGEGSALESSGMLTVMTSEFRNNATEGLANGGTAVVEDSTFSGNSGGHSTFVNNSGTLTVSNSIFRSNTMSCCAGGISNEPGATAVVEDSTFSDNSGGSAGGVVNGGDLTLTNVTIRRNQGGSGGGIFNFGVATVTASTISGNSATAGGGIFNTDTGTLSLDGTIVSRNSAVNGGGILNGGGTVTLDGTTVRGNTATYGGGIYNTGALTLIDSTVTQNIATGGPGSGGGILNTGGTVTLVNSTISRNRPDDCVNC